ncbi:Diacylglycerol kinase [Paraburkholderia tropica]|uniref:diacylglycerol kinase n=1 Tax=Paraburkholderia tropica TaxID=92647 RepID=UPI001CB34B83|nr:diacylglycerol kinase [Paraburkholderia tropica]CAG9237470.1 Diacylglycerol kinase [Paraburkholderia tropica]
MKRPHAMDGPDAPRADEAEGGVQTLPDLPDLSHDDGDARAARAASRASSDVSDATANHACDTAASTRTDMAPRPSTPPQPSSAPRDPQATHAAQPSGAPQPQVHAILPEPPEPAHLHEPLSPDDPLAPAPFNPYKGNRGVTRAWKALKYSIKGFRAAIREESAFRQELTLAAILVPIGIFVPVDPVERVLLLGSVMLVLIVELLNSSIENAVDRIGLERNELSGRAKDLGSAAVTVALLTCVMTWGLILVPRFGPSLLHWLQSR